MFEIRQSTKCFLEICPFPFKYNAPAIIFIIIVFVHRALRLDITVYLERVHLALLIIYIPHVWQLDLFHSIHTIKLSVGSEIWLSKETVVHQIPIHFLRHFLVATFANTLLESNSIFLQKYIYVRHRFSDTMSPPPADKTLNTPCHHHAIAFKTVCLNVKNN